MTTIVLDIEGTTTPIAFVHDVLFPYARAHLAFGADDVRALEAEYASDRDRPPAFEPHAYVHWLMDRDRKSTALKALQGRLWRHGYESGALRSIVYDDVPPALAAWTAAGATIAIYSSGSCEAQQLLFRYSNHGDLTPYIAHYFDTTTGPKRAAASYRAIAPEGREGVFISDVIEELAAAEEAGLTSVLSLRPGNAPVAKHSFPAISSFAELEEKWWRRRESKTAPASPYAPRSQEFPEDARYGPTLVDTEWDGTAPSLVQSPGDVLLRVLELSIEPEDE